MYNEKEFLNTITSIEQSETSELLIAKSEIIIPESKILLLDDMQIETSPNILLRQGYGAFSPIKNNTIFFMLFYGQWLCITTKRRLYQ